MNFGDTTISFREHIITIRCEEFYLTVTEEHRPFRFDMDRSSKSKDFEWAIGINRLMLRIIGLWPLDRNDNKIVLWKLQPLCTISIVTFMLAIPSLIALTKIWGDMSLMIDNLQYSIPYLLAIVKTCIFWYRKEDFLPLLNMIAQDWTKEKVKEEQDVMLWHAKISRTVATCAIFGIFTAVIIIFGIPYFVMLATQMKNLSNCEKSLPLPALYLYDVSKSPQFELTLLAQAFAVILSGISYSGVDNFLGLLILHICGQLENLHWRLTHVEKYSNFDTMVRCNVQDHIRLIRAIAIVDNIFNLMLLLMVLLFAIIFCLHGFLIVNVLNQDDQLSFLQLIWFSLAASYILLHMCLFCAAGEILVTQSEKVHRATYEYPWYTVEPKAAKNLTLIMLRASKPLNITAGKMVPMTMATFSKLLKTSAGYISVLLANQN